MTGDFLLPFPDQNLREKVALVNVATGLPEYIQRIIHLFSFQSSTIDLMRKSRLGGCFEFLKFPIISSCHMSFIKV